MNTLYMSSWKFFKLNFFHHNYVTVLTIMTLTIFNVPSSKYTTKWQLLNAKYSTTRISTNSNM